MQVTVSEAKAQLLDLVRRAQAGEEIILTKHGARVVRLVPETPPTTPKHRRMALEEMFGAARATEGPAAARSQDFLYDDTGLPR